MSKIRFYVMEDVPATLKEVVEALGESSDCEVVGSSSDIIEGYADILQLKPDALVLDITLSGGSAFELIDMLRKNGISIPPVVIMTGNDEFRNAQDAVDALGTALIKILKKPFWGTWAKDLTEIKATIIARANQLQEEGTLILRKTESQEELWIRSSHMTYRVILPNVLYMEADSGFTTIHSLPDKTIKVRRTLSDLLENTPSYFYRISRNHAINVHYIEQIDHETNEVFLEGCKENFIIGDPFKPGLKVLLGL